MINAYDWPEIFNQTRREGSMTKLLQKALKSILSKKDYLIKELR